ncbi:MAG: Sll0314/Alr1548 family TPR repeat-containing protein [Synechococcales cyanobacterium]
MKGMLADRWKPRLALGLSLILSGSLCSGPAWAKDPFRSGSQARPMTAELEGAFREVFCFGRYTSTRSRLEAAIQGSPDEPLAYALLSALAFQEGKLDEYAQLAQQTREVGSRLKSQDPVRGNLYEGIGQGMEAAYGVVKEGVVIGLPKALPLLNQMFTSLRAAQAADANDPEVNLFVGYIDLLLTNREKALAQFQKASPIYMALRGQSLTYRDMGNFAMALSTAEQALQTGCDNPELHYLKAQALVGLQRDADAVTSFDRALALGSQLPQDLLTQIQRERDGAQARLTGTP